MQVIFQEAGGLAVKSEEEDFLLTVNQH